MTMFEGDISSPLLTLLSTPPPSYELREAPGKGLGLFAKRQILEGELIIVERPLLFYASSTIGVRPVALYDELWHRIEPKTQAIVMSLVNVKDSHIPKFMGIIGTNSFQISLQGGSERYGGLFSIASRINHRSAVNLFPLTT